MPNQWLAFKWKTNTHITNYNSLNQLITGTTIKTADNQYNKMLNSQSKVRTRKTQNNSGNASTQQYNWHQDIQLNTTE